MKCKDKIIEAVPAGKWVTAREAADYANPHIRGITPKEAARAIRAHGADYRNGKWRLRK